MHLVAVKPRRSDDQQLGEVLAEGGVRLVQEDAKLLDDIASVGDMDDATALGGDCAQRGIELARYRITLTFQGGELDVESIASNGPATEPYEQRRLDLTQPCEMTPVSGCVCTPVL